MNDPYDLLLCASGFLAGVGCTVLVIAFLFSRHSRREREQRLQRPNYLPLRRKPLADVEPRDAWERDPDFWKGDHS